MLFIKEVYLIVEDLHADQDGSLVLGAPADGFHFAGVGILLEDVLVVVVQCRALLAAAVQSVKEEWEQHEVVVEVLEQLLVGLHYQVEGGVVASAGDQVRVCQPELPHEVGGQVLDLHGVGAHQ